MLNEEVLGVSQGSRDITAYPAPNIDPRAFGCAEAQGTVESVLGGTRSATSAGTDREPLLNLGNVQLLVNYYVINNGASGVQVTYANGVMVGMQTL